MDDPAFPADEASPRRLILIYWKVELVMIATDQIAYFYTAHSLTYIYCQDARVYTSPVSLDELQKGLDADHFFRSNRQFLIAIRAIDRIF
ncbi:LytTR family transcriptional regulator [Spirosoma aureum]|uniref:LytTR family transcriptional regulator n=1 Tax=Spirosoma aureum TaxID=2692134 RepID=A0A6G9AMP6_9BACT|nr:LytTR family DNA-binding domain-containing protein [Spirosoma aureum]QIP13688.1 LytTR family transcriptional regulator [Spirosoma aureum]